MKPTYFLKTASGTHPGRQRDINQDAVLARVAGDQVPGPRAVLLVADGMGGHQAGEIASQLAIETIDHSLGHLLTDNGVDYPHALMCPTDVGEEISETAETAVALRGRLQQAIGRANAAIYGYARENPQDAGNLGCTLTGVLVCGNLAAVANVGDSRTYLLREHKLEQLTADHSYVWQLVQEGHLQHNEIYDHPHRNVITRALGSRPEVTVDAWTCALQERDRLLLCSDGLWEMIRDESEIARYLESPSLEDAVDKLIDAANEYGGVDNIGVVVAELQTV
ncbi:MAG: protein phosphatase 2C domain-containing protein [Candidatus Promineifilaceae bacterium]|nr:protein phosphatase 2C domain-containing protein [Candidatus Promineifilaceae bacterium]